MKRSVQCCSCGVSMPLNRRAITKQTLSRRLVETAFCLLNVAVNRENEEHTITNTFISV